MKPNKSTLVFLVITLLSLAACRDNFVLPDQPLSNYEKVYMPQAVNGVKSFALKISDTAQEITYSASYGGQDYATQDIQVNFAVGHSLVDSFNKANGTAYAELSEKDFQLSATTANISKGGLSTGPLKISINTSGTGGMPILKDFLLPVTITSASASINESLRTAFFKIRAQPTLADYPVYDRSGWSIAGFSSQEASGEGANNGRAIFVLDNDPATYWHTQWQGASPGPPHFLVIDMGEMKTLHGLSFLTRQSDNNGKPQDVVVQTSTDNVTWTDAAAFTLENVSTEQPQFLAAFQEARYFKVIINTSYNASYTHLAELKAF